MQTALAIILGAVWGVVGFLPLFGGLRLSRRIPADSAFGQMGVCRVGLAVSFLVLLIGVLVCSKVARPLSLPFVLAEAIALSISAVSYGIAKMLRR